MMSQRAPLSCGVSTAHHGRGTATNGILGHTYTTNGTPPAQFIRDPNGALISMRTNNNNADWVSQYYTTDRLGSIILIMSATTTSAPSATAEATYSYDAWGDLTSGTPTGIGARNPYRYAGGHADTTGLTEFGTRYYDPTLGVWTQSDPAAQGPNYYVYAGDNPVTNADPRGRDSTDAGGEACAFFVCLEIGVETTEDSEEDHFHFGANVSSQPFEQVFRYRERG